MNVTVPVGTVPTTVAVNVTLAPASAGLAELASVVVDAPIIVCVSDALDDGLLPSPE